MTVTLFFLGNDDFDRPVYELDGYLYVDVDPRKDWPPAIHTKNNNDFYGEPCSPVFKDVEIVFDPFRITW